MGADASHAHRWLISRTSSSDNGGGFAAADNFFRETGGEGMGVLSSA
jgi:hypothetical protein